MAGSLNKVQIIGNLGRDPEVRTFQNGGKVVNLRIATSETWKDRTTGERKERTEWHSVAIFSEPICRVAEQYLKKGSKVYLEGQLETRKWTDQNNVERYSTEVVLRPYKGELTLLDRREGGGGRDEGGQYAGGGRDQGGSNGGYNGGGSSAPRGGQGQPPQRGAPYGGGPGYGGNGYGGRSGGGAGGPLDDDIPF
jgi:single-strand DNA-binding protein